MSVLHHESILEDCMEQAIAEFCEANKLTPDMFAPQLYSMASEYNDALLIIENNSLRINLIN